ncbi:MAG: putative metal-dependent hydrolase, partial [Elusimicrobia bacterium]
AGGGVGGEFARRCAHFAPELGVSYGKVRVKDMKSLWGSCSYRGDLSFNVRLLSAPPEVLDYVVVHELAHLRWRGHGRRFWELVHKHCPEQKERRRWLRANGPRLLQDLPGFGAAHAEDPQAAELAGQVAGQGEVEVG